MSTIIEICAGSLESCIAARDGGAHRVELCSALSLGGITPSYGVIALAKKEIDIDINVLIRPRQGDFLYNREEMEVMKKDIETCAQLKVAGVVFGALDKHGNVDLEFCKPLALLAQSLGLSFTFHRAIDRSANILQAVEDVISLGAQRILTSGGAATALEGLPVIKQMASIAAGRIIIMPGSGINATNIVQIVQGISQVPIKATKSTHDLAGVTQNKLSAEVHFSASQAVPSLSTHKTALSFTPAGLGGDYTNTVTSEQKIREAKNALFVFESTT